MKTVLFDIDGVLIDSKRANDEFYKELLFKIGGKRVTEKELNFPFVSTLVDSIKHFYPNLTPRELKRSVQLGFKIYPNFYHLEKLEKHVKEVLKKLKEKYRLGIVTSRLTVGVLDHFKLLSFFKVFITAKDFKHPKPHPEPILMAIEKLKATTQETVYVGDSKSDEEAARNANVFFIAYKNKSLKTLHHFSNFRQLPKMLAKIF